MANETKRIIEAIYFTDADAIAAITDRPGVRVYSLESQSWFFNNGTIVQEKEYQDQIDTLSGTVSGVIGDVSDLEANVSSLATNLTDLEATVSTIPSGPPGDDGATGATGNAGGLFVLGLNNTPFGATITGNSPAFTLHNLFIEHTAPSLINANIENVFLSSALVQSLNLSSLIINVTYDFHSTGSEMGIEITKDFPSFDLVCSTRTAESVSGTYLLFDAGSEPVGYFTTTYAGLDQSHLTSDSLVSVNDAYAIAPFSLGDADQPSTSEGFKNGTGISWDFDLLHSCTGPLNSLADYRVAVKLQGNELVAFSDYAFPHDTTTVNGIIQTHVTVDYLGLKQTGASTTAHFFRITVKAFSSGDGSSTIFPTDNVYVKETAIASLSIDQLAWFDIATTVDLDSANITSFSLIKAKAIQNNLFVRTS